VKEKHGDGNRNRSDDVDSGVQQIKPPPRSFRGLPLSGMPVNCSAVSVF